MRWCAYSISLCPVNRMQHISDMHSKFALRPHHVQKYGIQSLTAEIRRGKKRKKDRKKPQGKNIMSTSATQGSHDIIWIWKYHEQSSILSMNINVPPILDSNATPTEQMPLFASAATSPAHLVPCLSVKRNQSTNCRNSVPNAMRDAYREH